MAFHDDCPEPGQAHPAGRVTLLQTGVLLIVLLIAAAVIVPWLHRGRMLSRRSACMSNLWGIAIAEVTYAGQFSRGEWLLVPHAAPTAPEWGNVDYAPRKIGAHRWRDTTPADGEISTTRNLYGLLAYGGVSAQRFICPDSGDEVAKEDFRAFTDFHSIWNISYGQQVPYGQFGTPRDHRTVGLPLAADRGPFGAALESGAAPPAPPGVDAADAPAVWRPWNSPNHGGEGQNVLYADRHVSWCRVPVVGVNRDNIYTRWSRADGGTSADALPRTRGTPPSRNETPWSDTDALIYP